MIADKELLHRFRNSNGDLLDGAMVASVTDIPMTSSVIAVNKEGNLLFHVSKACYAKMVELGFITEPTDPWSEAA